MQWTLVCLNMPNNSINLIDNIKLLLTDFDKSW